ncbi:N-acetylmuramoyl-L-alanine amidase [Actinocrinis puniceicyclus]|nr:N-acetylmuramoyl-L-alanine amidase [Actinocrinis puniceicyclus]
MRRKNRRHTPAAATLLLTAITAWACAACGGGTHAAPTVFAAASESPVGGAGSSAAPGSSASTSASPSASASSPAAAAPAADSGLSGKVVVLDPGHDGGNETHPAEINRLVPQGFGQYKACDTTGTNGDDGYAEHQFAFQVALLVKADLEQRGLRVILTRNDDMGVGPCVNVRAAIGNNAHAAAAVSIHADGGPSGGHGYQLLEAVQSVGGSGIVSASHRLAVALHATFDKESGLIPSNYVGSDGYEPRDDIAGLNLSTVPKILTECGNMRNAGDLALEESATGRKRIARAIADGILAFLGQ